MQEKGKDLSADSTGIEDNGNPSPAEPARVDPEADRVLNRLLGKMAGPELEPETEREIETRRELNEVVQRMLVVGLILSTGMLLAGLVLSVIKHDALPRQVLPFGEILPGLKTGQAASYLSLGMVLLIATPVMRVFGSLVEFIAKRDWQYAAVTAIVLIILAISVTVGRG